MNKILQTFSNKKVRYGTFSTITALIVIAIILFLNLVVTQLKISADLTNDKLYSLTDETKDIIRGINEDITIYALFKTGQENDIYKKLLEEYTAVNSRIKLVYRDPYLYPQFVESYAKNGETIPVDSVIVESSKGNKVISASEMVSTTFNYETFETEITSIDIEPQVTNAIRNLTQGSTPKIYVITGHNEVEIPDELNKQITLLNNEIEKFDLLDKTEMPEDCSTVIITTPKRDWTPDEADVMRKYLQDGGRALFLVDIVSEKQPNLEGVLKTYGISLSNYVVIEGNNANYFQNTPTYIAPDLQEHDITKSIMSKGYRVLMPLTQAITQTELQKQSLKIFPLLTTSKDAYGRVDISNNSVNKQTGDVSGPFNLAVAVTDLFYTVNESTETRVVVIGTTTIFEPSMNTYIGGTNFDLISNSINWLQNAVDKVYISPKTAKGSALVMDQQQALIIMAVSVIVIPVVIFGSGIFVWLRRRNN